MIVPRNMNALVHFGARIKLKNVNTGNEFMGHEINLVKYINVMLMTQQTDLILMIGSRIHHFVGLV